MSRQQTAARVVHLVDRRVSLSELRQSIERTISSTEREEILALSRWFCRRYSTPLERLAYVRQAYRRWQRSADLTPRATEP